MNEDEEPTDWKYTAELLQRKYNEATAQLTESRRQVTELQRQLTDVRHEVRQEFAAQVDRRFGQLKRWLVLGE